MPVRTGSSAFDQLGLIQGSRKIPLAELDQRVGELDKARDVVTYCASDQCNASKQAAEKLVAQGFKVRAYEGGIKEWKEAGLPLEPAVTATTSSTSCCSS